MIKGYIKLYRQLQECWVWNGERYSRGQAWIDLLLLANHKEKKIPFNDDIITIERGQYLTSIRKLADRWGWSTSTVTSFLKLLEKDKMIVKNSNANRTLITIVNYSVYQDENTPTTTLTEQLPNTSRTVAETNKNEKNDKNDKNDKKRAFTPPSVDEVRAYCIERHNGIDPEAFIAFYQSKGWLIGKNKMKDWKAAVRTWENRRKEEKKELNQRDNDNELSLLEKRALGEI